MDELTNLKNRLEQAFDGKGADLNHARNVDQHCKAILDDSHDIIFGTEPPQRSR